MKNMTIIFLHQLLFITATLFFSTVGMLNAQSAVQPLTGIVIDQTNGEPIPGATIILNELSLAQAADVSGRFEFRSVPAGMYTLSVRSLRFARQTITTEHPADSPVRIELEPSAIVGEEVIVTSSPIGRSIQYQPAQAFNLESLQRSAAPSLGEILDGNPGVSTRSFGSAPARPVIRGMDGDRVLVLQNGERMGDLSSTAVDHAVALDPLAMDRVEVVRGPASLLYGSSAVGGVVNLFSSDMPREWIAGTNGSLATHLASVNDMGAGLVRLQHGTEAFAVTGRLIYRSGGDLRTPEGRLPDTSLENLSYGGGLGYRIGNFETSLSVNGMDYTYGLPEEIDDPNERVEIRMNRINLQSISTLRLGGFFEHAELRMQFSNYGHDEYEVETAADGSIDEELEISFDQQTLSSSLILRHRPIGTMEGAVGLSLNTTRLQVGGAEALTPDAEGYFLAGYIYEQIGIGNRLTMKAGLRGEYKETRVLTNELFTNPADFRDRSDLIFSGAAGLNFRPAPNWETGFQISRAYRTPTIEELYSDAVHLAAGSYDVGDPTLGNEISLATDAFVEYRSNKLFAGLALFYNRIDDFVEFSPTGRIHDPSGLPIFEYGSKDARFFGFEAELKMFLTDRLQAGFGFDFVRADEIGGDENPIAFIPPTKTSLSLTYDPGSWWLGSRLRIAGAQNRVAENEDPTDGYVLAGFDGGYRLGRGLSFAFRIDNLLNTSYRDHLSRVEDRNNPMPGRNINAMLRWDF